MAESGAGTSAYTLQVGVPVGTVTFLLTDIEGSTVRWERAPAAMRRALARHDALLHEGIAAHGGVVLTERGEGDSFFALFAQPGDALAAACALQLALAAEPWPREVAPLRVRMALHSGAAGMRAGADYRGAAPNRCARLRAVAHGGQVLLSGATHDLVREHLPPHVSLRDLGVHRLKDLLRPERIYQLEHPGLPEAFPPLASADERLRHLPLQLTTLVGREREIAAVRGLLVEEGARLLTLTGPGGVGKTRLALQVAAEAVEAFPDGVYFVNLAPLSDPGLVLPTIAQALGVVEQGGQPVAEALRARLSDTRTLLLLDNCEQVLDAAPDVAGLLDAGPWVVVLATSRAALRMHGEQTYAVPSLTLPAGGGAGADGDTLGGVPLETLTQSEAVRLFVARARDAAPDFVLTHQTAGAIAAVCARLDGLPLAIELAAARIRLLPPAALLARLERRLAVVTGGARDLPERQRTLRATIEWSYNLLAPEEQALFWRLAVFVGGCTLDAAAAIGERGDEPVPDVLEGLDTLLDQSLLWQREDAAGNARVGMLDTIREYAAEALEASGEAEAMREAHAAYYLALAEEAEPGLLGAEQAAWLTRLDRERDNLRAALQRAVEREEVAFGLRLAKALWWFWYSRGHLDEGRGWMERLLAVAERIDDGISLRSQRAAVLRQAAWLARAQGAHERATALAEECLAMYRAQGDRSGTAIALHDVGSLARERGEYGPAAALLTESLALFRGLHDIEQCAWLLINLGLLTRERGDYERARALYEESLSLFRGLGGKSGTAWALYGLGAVAREQGDPMRAATLTEESLALSRDLEEPWGTGQALIQLGRAASERGDREQALALCERGVAALRNLDGHKHLPEALSDAGWAAWRCGDAERAAVAFAKSVTFIGIGTPVPVVASCLEGIAGVIGVQRRGERSAQLLGAAATMRAAAGTPLPPVQRAIQARNMAAIRTLLGQDRFGTAWAAGQALSREQAIALAKGPLQS